MKKSGDIRKELALHGLPFNLLKGAFGVLLSNWLSLAAPVLQIQNEDIANRVVDMAFIDVVDYEQATGELRRIYDELIASRGKLAAVHTIQSLNPPTIISHMNLYKDIMFGQSPLKRYQREMIGVVVSVANECNYCTLHHREALLHFWKDENKADALISAPATADLADSDLVLCTFAQALTLYPGQSGEDMIAALKAHGWTDRAILDATLVVAYFNFVNRMVLGLGLDPAEGEIGGYKYD